MTYSSTDIIRSLAVERYFTRPTFQPPTAPNEPTGFSITAMPKMWAEAKLIQGALLLLLAIYLFSGGFLGIILSLPAFFYGIKFVAKGIKNYKKKESIYQEYSQALEDHEVAYRNWKEKYAACELLYQEELETVPSDAQMKGWLAEDMEKIKQEALETLDVEKGDTENKRIRPIIGNAGKDARALDLPIKFKRGDDGVLRGSYYKVVIVCLTDYHVASYECIVDMKSGRPVNSTTKEFPYKEITNLETRTSQIDRDMNNLGFRVKKTFSVATSGSDNIEVDYSFVEEDRDDSSEITGNAREAVETIRAIRSMLREYKRKFDG